MGMLVACCAIASGLVTAIAYAHIMAVSRRSDEPYRHTVLSIRRLKLSADQHVERRSKWRDPSTIMDPWQ